MSKKNQMIGRRGEKQFDLLCSEANVTCNGSTEDDFGWDKHIEFPPRQVPFAAIDMQPAPVAASVQVKATEGNSRSLTVRLSNALNYARSSLPQFIVLVVITEGKPRFFVKHVWAPLIAEWLKAARNADARGVTAVNRERVRITFEPEDEHSDDLLAWMEAQIVGVRPSYPAAKQLIVDTVGFENGHGTAHVTFKLESPHHFLDLQLGIAPPIIADRFVFRSERFGIEAGRPEIDIENAIFKIIPEGQSCLARFDYPSGKSVITLGRCYGATDGDKLAFRLSAGPIEIIYGPLPRVRATARLQLDDRLGLNELRAFAHFMASEAGAPIEVHLQLGQRELKAGSISMTGQKDASGWASLAMSTDALKDIVDQAAGEVPSFTINELNSVAQALQALNALASDGSIRIDYTPSAGELLRIDGFLAYTSAVIAGRCYSAVAYRPVGSDETKRGRRRVLFGSAKILWAQVIDAAHWSEDVVRDAYERHLDRLSKDAQLLAIGNIQKFIEQGPGEREIRSDLPTGRDTPLIHKRAKLASGRPLK